MPRIINFPHISWARRLKYLSQVPSSGWFRERTHPAFTLSMTLVQFVPGNRDHSMRIWILPRPKLRFARTGSDREAVITPQKLLLFIKSHSGWINTLNYQRSPIKAVGWKSTSERAQSQTRLWLQLICTSGIARLKLKPELAPRGSSVNRIPRKAEPAHSSSSASQKPPEQWHGIVLLGIFQGRGKMGSGSALKLPGFVITKFSEPPGESGSPQVLILF